MSSVNGFRSNPVFGVGNNNRSGGGGGKSEFNNGIGSGIIDSITWYNQSVVFYFLIVVGIVIGLACLSKWSSSDKKYSKLFLRKIKSLLDQATRLNGTAIQDTNSLLQLIHCNSALVTVQILKNLASQSDIESITGIDIDEMENYLDDCQNMAIENIGRQYPKLKFTGTSTSWM